MTTALDATASTVAIRAHDGTWQTFGTITADGLIADTDPADSEPIPVWSPQAMTGTFQITDRGALDKLFADLPPTRYTVIVEYRVPWTRSMRHLANLRPSRRVAAIHTAYRARRRGRW